MKNFRLAECCQNCAHCVVDHLQDDPFSYYCNVDGGYIPDLDLDARIYLGNRMLRLPDGLPRRQWPPDVLAFEERDRKRERWAAKHEVRAGNVCDQFKAKEK